ncbi:hypothetical protein D3C83_118320 [compost metagenome]
MTKLPSVMSSTSLTRRTADVPRCVSWLPNALCNFQFTLGCCACAALDAKTAVAANAAAVNVADFLTIMGPSSVW